jgi:hypothetical protein
MWLGKLNDSDSDVLLDTTKLPVVIVSDPTAEFRDLQISSQMFAIHVPQNYFNRCSDEVARIAEQAKRDGEDGGGLERGDKSKKND